MLLNYGEPQILELFKNTLPSKLYWVLFSINRQNIGYRDRNKSISRDRQRQNFRPNYRKQPQDRHIQHRCDNRRGSYRCQNYDNRSDSRERGRQHFRRNFSNDRYDSIERNRSRTRERCLTSRRNDRRHDSPNTNLGTRNRSNSRVTTNKQIKIGLDVIDAENMTILPMNILMQLQMIQMGMNQIELH